MKNIIDLCNKDELEFAYRKMSNEGMNSLTDQEFKNLACWTYGASFLSINFESFLGVCDCMINLTTSKQEAFDRLASWYDERVNDTLTN